MNMVPLFIFVGNELNRGRPDIVATPKNVLHGFQHAFARVAGHKTVAVDVRPDSAHLQNRRIGRMMTDGHTDGLFHLRLHAVGHQNDIEALGVARLVHILEAGSCAYAIPGALKPVKAEAQARLGRYNQ